MYYSAFKSQDLDRKASNSYLLSLPFMSIRVKGKAGRIEAN